MLHTLKKQHVFQQEIKRSRFVALAAPVSSSDAALEFIASYSDPDASHNCWAYRVKDDYRFHDDAEPAGSAGRPILLAIDGQQCDQTVVLVKRWFGGTKLGVGGLMRAYGGVAAQCLREAEKIPLVDEVRLKMPCTFADLARMQSNFSAFDIRVLEEVFDEHGVVWHLALPRDKQLAFTELHANLTRGQGLLEWLDTDDR